MPLNNSSNFKTQKKKKNKKKKKKKKRWWTVSKFWLQRRQYQTSLTSRFWLVKQYIKLRVKNCTHGQVCLCMKHIRHATSTYGAPSFSWVLVLVSHELIWQFSHQKIKKKIKKFQFTGKFNLMENLSYACYIESLKKKKKKKINIYVEYLLIK